MRRQRRARERQEKGENWRPILKKLCAALLHQSTAASTWQCGPQPPLGWVEMGVGLPEGSSYRGHSPRTSINVALHIKILKQFFLQLGEVGDLIFLTSTLPMETLLLH